MSVSGHRLLHTSRSCGERSVAEAVGGREEHRPLNLAVNKTALQSRLPKRANRGPVRQALTAARPPVPNGTAVCACPCEWFVNPALKAAAGPQVRVRHSERVSPAAGWACHRAVI